MTKEKTINIEKLDPTKFEKELVPYALICTKVIQNIKNFTAGFIWIYLQSKPPTWEPNKQQIMDHFDISEATYKRHMAYLSRVGLIEYHQKRGEKGRMMPAKLIVLNGSKFNESGDNFRGIIFDTADEPAPALDSDRGIILPVTGQTARTANELHINTIYTINTRSHTKEEEEFFLETSLYLDSEQQRKAIVMRELCLKDEKAIAKHAALKTDKTFIEVLNECISHYATQQSPQLVSPQRLQSWLNREANFQKQQELKKPQQNFPKKEERAAEYKKIEAREKNAEKQKREEVAATLGGIQEFIKKAHKQVNLAELRKKQEEEMKRLGMTPKEYHAYLTHGERVEREVGEGSSYVAGML